MSDLYKIAKSDKAVLKVFYDQDSESPREWDNLGTMVCWHRNYKLGNDHSYNDPNEFLKCMSEELIGYEDEGFIKEKADTFMTKYRIAKSTAHENGYSILEDGIIFDDGYNTVEDCEDELKDIRGHYIDEIYDDMSNDELLKLVEGKVIILPLFLYDHSGITMSTSDFGDRWDSGQVGWIYCMHSTVKKEFGKVDTETLEMVKGYLKGEVEIYDQYLRGDVYGYTLEKVVKCECCNHVSYEDIDSCWGYYGDDGVIDGIKDGIPDEYQYLINELNYAI